MPRLQAYAFDRSLTDGIILLALARWRENGPIEAACCTVDLWCEGIRTADYVELPDEDAWRDFVFEAFNEESRGDALEPACARALLEAAEAYGATNGFKPPPLFKKCRRILNPADPEGCSLRWTFGRDGRPHYVPMDSDSAERVAAVIARLESLHGPDGFTWEDPLETVDEPLVSPAVPERADEPASPPPAPPHAEVIERALAAALRRLKG